MEGVAVKEDARAGIGRRCPETADEGGGFPATLNSGCGNRRPK
ncbi:MAG: hypothetical protein ACUVX8_00030 [Candidatus Zipacnadales bacterium]